VEVIDLGCIDFVSLEDYGSFITKEYRIPIYRCPLKRLDVKSSI
jgi:hypothetical protein